MLNIVSAIYNWVLRHKLHALERLYSRPGKPAAAACGSLWKASHYFERINYYKD